MSSKQGNKLNLFFIFHSMHLFMQTEKHSLCPSLSAQTAVCASQGDFQQ